MKVFLCSLLVLWSVVWCWVLVVLVLNFFYGRCPIEGPWRVRRRRVASLDPIATLHTLVISVSVPVPVQLYHGSSTDL